MWLRSDRSQPVLNNLQRLFDNGRLAGTGYVSILPVDQGVEHSGAASFAPNPQYFDPSAIAELAYEGGCNAVASTVGVLGAISRDYAHKIPLIVKINHNEILSYPNTFDQTMYASVDRAWNMGAAGVGATIYFGSEESRRQIWEVAQAFERAHELGMFTVLWCYLRSSGFKRDGKDFHTAADLTGQANHLGVTIEADIIKQKLPELNGGYTQIAADGESYGKTSKLVYTDLSSDNPIDLCRHQVLNATPAVPAHQLRRRLGSTDLAGRSVPRSSTSAGGTGLITGRKAFQRPMNEGIEILNAVRTSTWTVHHRRRSAAGHGRDDRGPVRRCATGASRPALLGAGRCAVSAGSSSWPPSRCDPAPGRPGTVVTPIDLRGRRGPRGAGGGRRHHQGRPRRAHRAGALHRRGHAGDGQARHRGAVLRPRGERP